MKKQVSSMVLSRCRLVLNFVFIGSFLVGCGKETQGPWTSKSTAPSLWMSRHQGVAIETVENSGGEIQLSLLGLKYRVSQGARDPESIQLTRSDLGVATAQSTREGWQSAQPVCDLRKVAPQQTNSREPGGEGPVLNDLRCFSRGQLQRLLFRKSGYNGVILRFRLWFQDSSVEKKADVDLQLMPASEKEIVDLFLSKESQ